MPLILGQGGGACDWLIGMYGLHIYISLSYTLIVTGSMHLCPSITSETFLLRLV